MVAHVLDLVAAEALIRQLVELAGAIEVAHERPWSRSATEPGHALARPCRAFSTASPRGSRQKNV